MVVRADIENNRQAVFWRNAGTGGVECQLAERYAHSPGAKIAEPKNALTVGDHDEANVFLRPIAENLLQSALGADRQVHAARRSEDVAELLARFANSRRIDEGHVGGRVGHQDGVEQPFVARLQVGKHQILLQIVAEVGDLDPSARHLQVDCGYRSREQPFEPELASFRFGEGSSFVEAGVVKQVIPRRLLRRESGHIRLRWVRSI